MLSQMLLLILVSDLTESLACLFFFKRETFFKGYHKECDSFANINKHLLGIVASLSAGAIQAFGEMEDLRGYLHA
jgi:hypothetical protein